jgi:hypothetical protein
MSRRTSSNPTEGATTHGDLRRALFNRTWEHFTSHQHAPVGDSLDAPVVVTRGNVLYFAAPLFAAYRNFDYWAYRALAQHALDAFLPAPLLQPCSPSWVEFTLHRQPAAAGRPARRLVHIVAYHPRRSLQSIPHVDQSWPTAGLSFNVRSDDALPARVYLAPGGEPLPFTAQGGYLHVELPPAGTHTVVVLE